MTTRFTSTEKWQDKWFRSLSAESKLLFLYIIDNCDLAGFWEIDLDFASYMTGIEKTAILGAFEGLNRAYYKVDGFIWLKNFIKHQRNYPLNPSNNAHKHILGLIDLHPEFKKEIKSRGCLGADEPPCKVTYSNSKGNSKGNGNVMDDEFIKYWNSKPELPHIRAFNKDRQRKLALRMKDKYFSENWRGIIDKLAETPFCLGKNDRGWKADVSWLLANGDNHVKLMEGRYTKGTEKEKAREAELIKELRDI